MTPLRTTPPSSSCTRRDASYATWTPFPPWWTPSSETERSTRVTNPSSRSLRPPPRPVNHASSLVAPYSKSGSTRGPLAAGGGSRDAPNLQTSMTTMPTMGSSKTNNCIRRRIGPLVNYVEEEILICFGCK